jgi:hypothetical protein
MGFPVWAMVLVACVAAPLLVRAWIEHEERKAKDRTTALLQRIGVVGRKDHGLEGVRGTRRAGGVDGGNQEEAHGSTVRTDR